MPPDHIPALAADKLAAALEKLKTVAVNPNVQKKLAAMLRAAANPNSEAVDVIIASLPEERRINVMETDSVLTRFTTGITSRAKQSLSDISDDEWERLTNDVNAINEND